MNVDAARLARDLGVSDRMIRTYVAEGMPRLARGKYNRAACLKWVHENHPQTGHGGKRPGAGKAPKKGKKADAPPPASSEANAAREEDASTFRALQRRRLSASAEIDELELAKRAGDLLDRQIALDAVRAFAQQVRQLADRLPLSASKRIVADLNLPAPELPKVREALKAELQGFYRALAAQPIPDGLGGPAGA